MGLVIGVPALLVAEVLRLAQRPVHLFEGSQEEAEVTPGDSKWVCCIYLVQLLIAGSSKMNVPPKQKVLDGTVGWS